MLLRWIMYQRRLGRLAASKRSLQKEFSDLHAKAREANVSADDRYALMEREFFEVACIEDEIAALQSEYLVSAAYDLNVTIPGSSEEGAWETSSRTGLRHLTERAMASVQAAVRNEQRERLQVWELRVKIVAPALAGLIGVLGALTGLVAILYK